MTTGFDCEVLVVGAGPTGLSAALSLAVQGVDVRIVDDKPARHTTARASNIHARTLELLAPLGVADRILAYAQPVRSITFFDRDGVEVLRRQPQPVDSQFPPLQNLQQWHVEWVLAEQLVARGVTIQAGTSLTGLTQTADGVVATVGTQDGPAEIRCRYLVGADGARSAVRHACGTRMVGTDYPERWIGGEIELEDPQQSTGIRALFTDDRVALSFPLDSGFLFFATLRDDEWPDSKPGPVDAARVLQVHDASFGAHPHLSARALRVPWTGQFVMHSCCVPDYRINRVFLAGDAAHLCSAAGGFGMNAGIQDAINLAWRLAAHLRLEIDESILDGYNTDRREMFAIIQAASDRAHQMMVGRNAAALRDNTVIRSMAGMAAADREVGEVAFVYRNDRMWRDEAESGSFRAGMRVPPLADFSGGEGAPRPWSGIYDGFNWTVVLAVPDRTAVRTGYIRQIDLAALVWLKARVRIVVAVGDAFAWNAPRPTIYLVRPDGYIAFRCDADPESLPDVRCLSTWLGDCFGAGLLRDPG
jgi:2-polyprenyl-6-methoxyphenol hydroxylase-like FAD-dependent oxidoreductase